MQEEIKKEVTRQLLLVKKQTDIEHKKDIETLKNNINLSLSNIIIKLKNDIMNETSELINLKLKSEIRNVEKKLDENKQLIPFEQKKEIMMVCGEMGQHVYKKVMSEINNKVLPKLDATIESINYHTQDTDGLINDYRRAVHEQYNGPVSAPNTPLITSGKGTTASGNRISSHVGLFFSDND